MSKTSKKQGLYPNNPLGNCMDSGVPYVITDKQPFMNYFQLLLTNRLRKMNTHNRVFFCRTCFSFVTRAAAEKNKHEELVRLVDLQTHYIKDGWLGFMRLAKECDMITPSGDPLMPHMNTSSCCREASRSCGLKLLTYPDKDAPENYFERRHDKTHFLHTKVEQVFPLEVPVKTATPKKLKTPKKTPKSSEKKEKTKEKNASLFGSKKQGSSTLPSHGARLEQLFGTTVKKVKTE